MAPVLRTEARPGSQTHVGSHHRNTNSVVIFWQSKCDVYPGDSTKSLQSKLDRTTYYKGPPSQWLWNGIPKQRITSCITVICSLCQILFPSTTVILYNWGLENIKQYVMQELYCMLNKIFDLQNLVTHHIKHQHCMLRNNWKSELVQRKLIAYILLRATKVLQRQLGENFTRRSRK